MLEQMLAGGSPQRNKGQGTNKGPQWFIKNLVLCKQFLIYLLMRWVCSLVDVCYSPWILGCSQRTSHSGMVTFCECVWHDLYQRILLRYMHFWERWHLFFCGWSIVVFMVHHIFSALSILQYVWVYSYLICVYSKLGEYIFKLLDLLWDFIEVFVCFKSGNTII